MRKVFEPSELDFADVLGDPNQVIEIQAKVRELLHANRQRQRPLLAEIAGRGAWALPGVINATYIWMNELEVPQTQGLLAELMADLARGNTAATALLFRAGILATPFPVPRAICRRALELLSWQPDERQTNSLRQEITIANQLGDVQTMLDLYGLLFRAGSQADLTAARTQCIGWVREKRAEAGALLKLLVDHVPSQVAPIVSAVFAATIADRQDRNLANSLLHPLRPPPPDWLENDMLSSRSSDARTETSSEPGSPIAKTGFPRREEASATKPRVRKVGAGWLAKLIAVALGGALAALLLGEVDMPSGSQVRSALNEWLSSVDLGSPSVAGGELDNSESAQTTSLSVLVNEGASSGGDGESPVVDGTGPENELPGDDGGWRALHELDVPLSDVLVDDWPGSASDRSAQASVGPHERLVEALRILSD